MKTKAPGRKNARSRISAVVSHEGKRRLRKASKSQERSMSSVVDDLLKQLPEEPDLKTGPGMGERWVKENSGLLHGKFTKADYERDDLLGYLLRKHAS